MFPVLNSGLTRLAFCFASSVAYIFNDIADRDGDRLHPKMRSRYLASGRIGVGAAAVEKALVWTRGSAVGLKKLMTGCSSPPGRAR